MSQARPTYRETQLGLNLAGRYTEGVVAARIAREVAQLLAKQREADAQIASRLYPDDAVAKKIARAIREGRHA